MSDQVTPAPIRGVWIPENRASRIPRSWIFLDSEARIDRDAAGETHTFRCAVTSSDKMSRRGNQWQPTELAVHDNPTDLWQWVANRCKPKERTILVAHNAGYDLRVCQAFSTLPSMGFRIERLSLQPGATWVTFRRGTSTLVIVDSLTWLPLSLAKIGQLMGMEKLSLPTETDSERAWIERCTSDVAILRAAFLRVVKWCRDDDLGNWRPTGAGMAWSAWRHKHLTHRILAHGDTGIRERERRAAWTGRAEPWRFGKQSDGPWTEWDFECCYANIARDYDVPTKLVGELHGCNAQDVARMGKSSRILADVMVETDTPTVPTEHDGKIVWPTGRFRSTLWECEIELALAEGATVTVERAWKYRAAPALKQWAEWVLGLAMAPAGTIDPIIQTVAKHWSRALIGRFGSRFPTWEPYGDALGDGASLSQQIDYDTGETAQRLEIGGQAWLATVLTDHPHSAPQVMSWINAKARVSLWRAMVTAGLSNVLYVDTDSLIVNAMGDQALSDGCLNGLRRKARYQSIEIVGTRRLILDRKIRASGIPTGAVRTAPRTWRGEVWSSTSSDLSIGSSSSVRVTDRTITLRDRDSRRRRGPNGISEPWRIDNV